MSIVNSLIITAILLLAGCGSPSVPTDSTDTSGAVSIRMPTTGFEQEKITVPKGAKVCFINDDTEARWPASNIHPTHEIYSDFDPKTPVRSGDTWCFTFTKAGIWQMHDHLYPEFVGSVTVE